VERYAGAQSRRVERLVLMGTPLGLGVMGQSRQMAIDFCAHWPPIVPAIQDGSLEVKSLSQEDQATWQRINVPVVTAWAWAMLDWPSVEPGDSFARRCGWWGLRTSRQSKAIDYTKKIYMTRRCRLISWKAWIICRCSKPSIACCRKLE